MRIAFLSPWQNVVQRGVEGVVREITKRLSRHHEIDIFSTGRGNGIVTVNADIRSSGLLRAYENISRMFGFSRLFETGFPPIGPGDMQAFYFAHKAFKKMIEEKLNYDAVSIFCGLYGDVCAAWYRRKTGIPFIHNDHGGSVQDRLAILTKPDAFICITPLIVEYHKKRFLGRRTKIHMIPNGVDLDVFKPECEKTTLVDLGKMEHPIVLSTSAPFTSKEASSANRGNG